MKNVIPVCVLAVALGVSANAQDNTVKTKTQVKADDARTVMMKGCLVQVPGSGAFMLHTTSAVSGEDLTTKSRVKTDVDRDETKVTGKTETTIDRDDDKAVGTSGASGMFELTPGQSVNLAIHVGKQVEISGVMIDASKGDDDADVKIEQKTRVEKDDAPDAKVNTKTKAEIPRGATNRLMAMSVTSSGASCAAN